MISFNPDDLQKECVATIISVELYHMNVKWTKCSALQKAFAFISGYFQLLSFWIECKNRIPQTIVLR